MPTPEEIYSALAVRGFSTAGGRCFGTWRNYAVCFTRYAASTYTACVAVRPEKASGALRKTLRTAIKGSGLKNLDIQQVNQNFVVATIGFPKDEAPDARLSSCMDCLTGVLRANGMPPADTCILSGAPHPDSLCLTALGNFVSFQPVSSTALRSQSAAIQQRVEENENNGSRALGLIGALLGMLVGVAANLLTIIGIQRIYAFAFALVPVAAMFGYKLFKGKMDKGAVITVLAVSVLAVPLMLYLEYAIYLMKDGGAALGDALSYVAALFTDPGFLSDVATELLQLLVFMALGVFVAWRFLSSQTNRTQLGSAMAQQESMRPNPNYTGYQTPLNPEE